MQPSVTVTELKVIAPLASSTIGGKVYGKTADSGSYGLSREDNAWNDIWGTDEEED